MRHVLYWKYMQRALLSHTYSLNGISFLLQFYSRTYNILWWHFLLLLSHSRSIAINIFHIQKNLNDFFSICCFFFCKVALSFPIFFLIWIDINNNSDDLSNSEMKHFYMYCTQIQYTSANKRTDCLTIKTKNDAKEFAVQSSIDGLLNSAWIAPSQLLLMFTLNRSLFCSVGFQNVQAQCMSLIECFENVRFVLNDG